MSARNIFLSAVMLAALAALAVLSSAGPPVRLRHVYADRFPRGSGDAIAGRACVGCHAATLVTQQAKDSTAWEKSLAQMQKWGLELSPAEHDSLRAYLVTQFGPRRRTPAPGQP